MNKDGICFNCGKRFTETNHRTKEHIPMKALYTGFLKKLKNKIITVPSCFECNQEYSRDEAEFRNVLGIKSLSDNKMQIASEVLSASLRGFLKSGSVKEKIISKENYSILYFENNKVKNSICKIFKGLFFYKYAQCFPHEYDLKISHTLFKFPVILTDLINLSKSMYYWDFSGHSDIFEYQIRLELNNIKSDMFIFGDTIICEMIFYRTVYCYIVASKSI